MGHLPAVRAVRAFRLHPPSPTSPFEPPESEPNAHDDTVRHAGREHLVGNCRRVYRLANEDVLQRSEDGIVVGVRF